MRTMTGVRAGEPVSDMLRQAARLGLELQPEAPPCSTVWLYSAIYDSLIPQCLAVKQRHRRRIALDTAITLCAEHAGKRLVPRNVRRVEHTIARCFALYGLSRESVPPPRRKSPCPS